jgi:hypothetical protein
MAAHTKMNFKDDVIRRQRLTFIEQSEDFYNSASTARIASKPLLYYYSFMNLAKAFISVKKNEYLGLSEHGLFDYDKGRNRNVTITSLKVTAKGYNPSSKRMQVYQETIENLGFRAPRKNTTFGLTELFDQTVSIHELLSHTLKSSIKFFPVVNISFKHDPLKKKAWVSFQIKCDDLAFNQNAPHEIRKSLDAFSEVESRDGQNVREYESKAMQYRRNPIEVLQALVEQTKKDVWSYLSPGKYSYYVSSIRKGRRLSQIGSCYKAMFYMGSIVRYRPDDFSRLLEGRHGWIIQEFVQTQQLQFVYLLGSAIINAEMIYPEAAL